MTQGELEKLPAEIVKQMNMLQIRIMDDIVRRIRINGFSTASADWQISRLQQLGMAEEDIRKWIRQVLNTTEEEVDRIFSDEVYEQYMGHARAYNAHGQPLIPFEENDELQQTLEAIKAQTMEEFRNMTGSLGFVTTDPARRLRSFSLSDYYVKTLDEAIMDIHSGAFDYNTVLRRTINEMTASGLRWIDYESGWHNRVPVAARRAVMTGFRQVQGKINEQVARDLHLDTYEVTVHIGARPTHQPWEGKVWTMEQLRTVCGLGTVTGLHGANCYHDYNAFDPEFDVRTYSDEELERIHEEENTPKTYMGKEYTTYEALQRQRQLETRARKYREDVHLLEQGMEGVSEEEAAKIKDTITLTKARYQGTLQEYQAFSKKMDLPTQKERIYQDGLKVDMRAPKNKGADSGETRERRIHFAESEKFERDAGAISAKKVKNKGYNNLYVDENVSLKPKELRRINSQITEAKNLLGVSEACASKFVIVDDERCLAAYNPRTDIFYISRIMADEKNILMHQAGFACPENPNSTLVHEMFHWKDAEEYRKTVGIIESAHKTSHYTQWERSKAETELIRNGVITPFSAMKISRYALRKYLDNEFEEVYTELRTSLLLRR